MTQTLVDIEMGEKTEFNYGILDDVIQRRN